MDQKHIQKLKEAIGQSMDMAPVALLYYDESTGKVLFANKNVRNLYYDTFGRDLLGENLYQADIFQPSTIEKMRNRKQFDFYSFYDEEGKQYMPASPKNMGNKTLFIINFVSYDDDGNYLTSGLVIRPLTNIQKEMQRHELEAAKLKLLSSLYGLTQLQYDPYTRTMEMIGGRDHYNVTNTSIRQISNLVHPDDRKEFLSIFNETNITDPKSFSCTVRVISHKLKSYRYFKVEFYPQFNIRKELISYGGFGLDVTEEQQAINQQAEEIHQLMVDKEEATRDEKKIFGALANISHDLRNPLNAIMGFCELISASDDAEERAEYNKIVQESANRLQGMINEILDINRLEAGEIKVQMADVDLGALLEEVYMSYQLQFQSNGIELCYIPLDKTCMINTDEHRVREILENYISNALKNTKQGSVTLKTDCDTEGVCIHVTDTGIGISEENCQRVFNRFEMLDSRNKGHGLGLNICKKIAEALGGDIGVTSELGKGSDFWLRLPLAPAEAQSDQNDK